MDLRLLARVWRRTRSDSLLGVITLTLDKMAAGGMYDQLGGGFHRYSVDECWLVPHFEKMLYDNALLVPCYLDAFLITANPDYARVARETCDYVLREMTDAAGGFYSTQDADSEGEEGKFFVWKPEEIEEVLGKRGAETFAHAYDVTPEGNFEHGTSILNRPKTLAQSARILSRDASELERELVASRTRLLAARDQRVHPGLDDKVLVAWNALMIEALVQAAGVLDEPRYLAAAQRCAGFLLTQMRRADGRLLHVWRRGTATLDAYLDDYAALACALVTLYEADFDERWLDTALALSDAMLAHFEDPSDGGFFYTAADHEQLIVRPKDFYDNALPSGNSLAAVALVRLAKLTGRQQYLEAAERTLRAATPVMRQAAMAAGQMLMALDMYLGPTAEIVFIGDPKQADTAAALSALRKRFIPNKVVACREPNQSAAGLETLAAMFAGKSAGGPQPAVYVCQNFACQAPVHGREAAVKAWDDLASAR
jgi:uncharacterized protein YyaL (SSP411 family)